VLSELPTQKTPRKSIRKILRLIERLKLAAAPPKMKVDRVKTPENPEEVSSYRVVKRVEGRNGQRSDPAARKIPMGGLENGLANQWSSKKITKKVHAGRGEKAKWEIPIKGRRGAKHARGSVGLASPRKMNNPHLKTFFLIVASLGFGHWLQAQVIPQTLLFNGSGGGLNRSITNWGLDVQWANSDNMKRGIMYMGSNNVSCVRVGFVTDAPFTNNALSPHQQSELATGMNVANMAGDKPWEILPQPGVDPWFTNGAGAGKGVIVDRWVEAMDLAAQYYRTNNHGKIIACAEPFNEPDYSPWDEGPPENLYSIMDLLKSDTNFTGADLVGPSTLNCDRAWPSYTVIKNLARVGTTHALAGTYMNYIGFIQKVNADGALSCNPEVHNLVEVISGAEYGLGKAIWWGTAELARGSFVNACQGTRLAYAENSSAWSSAAVYRAPNNAVQGFLGSSERMGLAATYRFFSQDRDVFYNGYGPRRDFTVSVPGNCEVMFNITWGSDVPPAVCGRYAVVNRKSGKVMEVPDASTSDGVQLDLSTYRGANNQLWDIYPIGSTNGIGATNGDLSYFTMRAVHDEKAADDINWSYKNGNAISQWGSGGNSVDQWFFEYAGNGYFYIRNRWSGLCLDATDDALANGGRIIQWAANGKSNQQWRLIPAGWPVQFVAPAAPTGLVAKANAVSVELSWAKNVATNVAGYTVLRSTNCGGPYEIVARGLGGNDYTDSSANKPVTYYYVVQAVDTSLNTSSNSIQVNAKPLCIPTMVAQYPLAGNANDASGNANNAVLHGPAAYAVGKNGLAMKFNGTNVSAELPAGMMASVTNFTIATWVYWGGGSPWQRIFDFGNGAAQNMFLTPNSGAGTLRFAITTNSASGEQVLQTSPMAIGEWEHVAVTLNGNILSLYTNGILATSNTSVSIAPNMFNPALNYLGVSQYPEDPAFNGLLSDVCIYNYALNGVQIERLASAIAPAIYGSASPSTVLRNHSTLITASVKAGSGTIMTNGGVLLNLTSMNGCFVPLVCSNSSCIYTNTIVIPATATRTNYSLVATISDNTPLTGSTGIVVNVMDANVWKGGGSNENWSTDANWVGGSAPNRFGESLVFAGVTNLSPNVDNSYNVNGIFFSDTAGSFSISSDNNSMLLLSLKGIANNSTNPQTLNVAVRLDLTPSFNAANGDIILNGCLTDDGAGWSKAGNGVLTLAGHNNLTGPAQIGGGILNLTGAITPGSIILGSTAGNIVMKVSGSLIASNLFVGDASNAIGAVYQTGGTVSLSGGTGGDLLNIGNASGSFGYYEASRGTLTVAGISIGGESNPNTWPPQGSGNGMMEVNGATINDTGWIALARGGDANIGILNVYSGLLTYAGGGIGCNWQLSGANQTSIINIMGGRVTSSNQGGYFRSRNKAVVNLNGGLLEANGVAGSGTVNFNGGTLEANGAVSLLAVDGVYLYSRGATVDNNGYIVTIERPLMAPVGKGVYGISSFTGGTGYIAPPIIIITNGVGDTTGAGATAIAEVNPATGTVTNIIITCPGVNYTAKPGFMVIGGGAITPATITAAEPVTNISGGLTSIGSGKLVLSGADTYTGNTTVNAGTLEVVQAVLATNSTVTVIGSAKLQLDFSTTNTIAALVLNGTNMPSGVYNSLNEPKFIAGLGSLELNRRVRE
jgi:autotransporter-associated beta strand protein